MTNLNIENLTSLWKTIGQHAQAYHAGPDFDYCAIAYSDWPNRLWFNHDMGAASVAAAKKLLPATPTPLILPYWSNYHQSDALSGDNGFVQVSEQFGMSLPLTRTYPVAATLRMEKVTTKEMATRWEELFIQAFGYRISYKLLMPDYENISFFSAFHLDEPIGTCLLHNSGKHVLGIHALGIIPQGRGKGLARQMMHIVLNQAIGQEFTCVTLQASAMARELYVQLGFAQDFLMKNYTLSPLA